MNKKLLTILIVIITLVILMFGFIYGLKEYKISRAGLTDYYKILARQCSIVGFISGFDCCFSTVIDMSNSNLKAPDENGCPEGQTTAIFLCSGSMEYCAEPLDLNIR